MDWVRFVESHLIPDQIYSSNPQGLGFPPLFTIRVFSSWDYNDFAWWNLAFTDRVGLIHAGVEAAGVG